MPPEHQVRVSRSNRANGSKGRSASFAKNGEQVVHGCESKSSAMVIITAHRPWDGATSARLGPEWRTSWADWGQPALAITTTSGLKKPASTFPEAGGRSWVLALSLARSHLAEAIACGWFWRGLKAPMARDGLRLML